MCNADAIAHDVKPDMRTGRSQQNAKEHMSLCIITLCAL